ncbi:MAG: MFS transporter, partial [Actinomycetota bacterium]
MSETGISKTGVSNTGTDRAGPRRSSLRALRHRDFALFWTAAAISNGGGWMQLVAVPALLYDLTGSSTWLGVASMAGLLPAVFLTPHAG